MSFKEKFKRILSLRKSIKKRYAWDVMKFNSACLIGDEDSVRLFFKYNENISRLDYAIGFRIACVVGQLNIVKVFVEEIDPSIIYTSSAFHHITNRDQFNVIQYFVKKGYNLDDKLSEKYRIRSENSWCAICFEEYRQDDIFSSLFGMSCCNSRLVNSNILCLKCWMGIKISRFQRDECPFCRNALLNFKETFCK